jgi:hypothetical protein
VSGGGPFKISEQVLLANDFDPDGDVLALVRANSGGLFPGTVEVTADTLLISPGPEFTGSGHFVYCVQDVYGAKGCSLVELLPDVTGIQRTGIDIMFALKDIAPNPTKGTFGVRFVIPSDAPAKIEVFDISGRLALAQDVGQFGPGEHRIVVGGSPGLRSGVYLVRLTQAGRQHSRRVAVVR